MTDPKTTGLWHNFAGDAGSRRSRRAYRLQPVPMASVAPGRVHLWEMPVHWLDADAQRTNRQPLLGLARKGPDKERAAARSLRGATEAAGYLWLKSRPQVHTSPCGYDIKMRQGFWTFTVPEPMPEHNVRTAFSSYLTWARNVAGINSYLWVAELTHRGRAHIHGLFNEWMDVDRARAAWLRALQREGCSMSWNDRPSNLCDVKAVASAKKARGYVTKYVGKDFGNRADQLVGHYRNAVCGYEDRKGWHDPRPDFVPEIRARLFDAIAQPGKLKRRWGASNDLERKPYALNGYEDPKLYRALFDELNAMPGTKWGERSDTGQPCYYNLDAVSKASTPALFTLLHA